MDYQQALDYIFSYTDYEKVHMPHAMGGYDLRRVEELLARLGNPHQQAHSVHIAGTNGKGSTAAMIASVLSTAGYRTGLYTSPHLNTIRERFQIDGVMITEEEFTRAVRRLKPQVERINHEATYGELTTFEILTALAFIYFVTREIDFQVLEVGLGGKFDATNVIQPEVSVITSISYDHTEILGKSLAEIATEKAGIIKPGTAVVLAPQADEVVPVIERICRKQNAALVMVGKDVSGQRLGFDGTRQSLEVKGRRDSYQLAIPLLGHYQLENTASAVAALEILAEKGFHISRDDIINGLARVSWPGRLQVLRQHPTVVADGAHNPDGARRLKQSLTEYFDFERAVLVMGASADKDVAGVVKELAPIFDKVIATQAHHPRAMAPDELAAKFSEFGVMAQSAASVSSAISLALSIAGERDLICVAGSLFVVAEAIEAACK
jgi:dihydrofolate synthase/folylpolyglutamate synthase